MTDATSLLLPSPSLIPAVTLLCFALCARLHKQAYETAVQSLFAVRIQCMNIYNFGFEGRILVLTYRLLIITYSLLVEIQLSSHKVCPPTSLVRAN